jgi:hypothetical protein
MTPTAPKERGEMMARKQRAHVYLQKELLEWAENTARKLSYERGEEISRNNVIEMALELLRKQLESETTGK